MPQGQCDLALALAHARKNAPARVAARGDDALQLPAADDVEPAAQPRQEAQDRLVGVGLDGEADQVSHPGHRPVQALEMAGQGLLRVNVQGRAKLPGEPLDGDAFAAKPVAGIVKFVHGEDISGTPDGDKSGAGHCRMALT